MLCLASLSPGRVGSLPLSVVDGKHGAPGDSHITGGPSLCPARAYPVVMAGKGVANGLLGALRLKRYWTTGEGGAKIAWGTPGDDDRCMKLVGAEVPPGDMDVKGYCANLHHAATGMWPGDKRNK